VNKHNGNNMTGGAVAPPEIDVRRMEGDVIGANFVTLRCLGALMLCR
jgi:hypothetical protein